MDQQHCKTCGLAIERNNPDNFELTPDWNHVNGYITCPKAFGIAVAEPEEV